MGKVKKKGKKSTIKVNSRGGNVTKTQYKVQELSNGQLVITIPSSLAQALGIEKGTSFEWKFDKTTGRLYLEQEEVKKPDSSHQ